MSSTFNIEHNRLFSELKELLKSDIAQITGKANGGRSILFVYPPVDETNYISAAKTMFQENEYRFIDIRDLFTRFLSEKGLDDFKINYKDFGNEMFFSDNFYDETFFATIIKAIKSSYEENKTPILIHIGTIYGMGFSNINIMEHKMVMESKLPLIVFYPAEVDKDNIKFLGRQIASKYRCIVIK